MNKLLLLFTLLFLASCSQSDKPDTPVQSTPITAAEDNQELIELYRADQNDRKGEIDWSVVSQNDRNREERVYELLDSNKVITANDYANAAMIFQHGKDTVASSMAVKLMKKNLELDPTANKWLYAAAVDRDKMYRDEPQIFGTQYRKLGDDEPWFLYKIDSTVVTDDERIAHGVETLAQQREKERTMNLKQLSEMQAEGASIDEILAYCMSAESDLSKYDISENGLNNFGYGLIQQGNLEDALQIFKLNTELRPEAFNPWDSYGECLMLLDKTDESIAAYEKSLELNPANVGAKNALDKLKSKL